MPVTKNEPPVFRLPPASPDRFMVFQRGDTKYCIRSTEVARVGYAEQFTESDAGNNLIVGQALLQGHWLTVFDLNFAPGCDNYFSHNVWVVIELKTEPAFCIVVDEVVTMREKADEYNDCQGHELTSGQVSIDGEPVVLIDVSALAVLVPNEQDDPQVDIASQNIRKIVYPHKVHLRKISVVVPVYNSQDSLEPLVARLESTLEHCAGAFEILLVNDDSADNSWQVICELVDKYEFVEGINLMRNYGQHNALLAGIRTAQYDIIVTIDDDLQHPPEEIGKLLEKLDDGADVVYGTPQAEQHGFFRDISSQITKIALRSIMNVEIARNVGAFRVFRTHLRDAFADYCGTRPSIDVLLTWGTKRFSAVPVRHVPRQQGASNYTFRKLVGHAVNMITGFSTLPLRIASILGFSFTVFGIVMLMYVVVRYVMSGTSVAGFPFLASIISIFSGVQLFALGIMGEYLARMHLRLMDQPSYSIREIKGTT